MECCLADNGAHLDSLFPNWTKMNYAIKVDTKIAIKIQLLKKFSNMLISESDNFLLFIS